MSDHEKDGFGLDKSARLAAARERQEAEQAAAAASLDPPFPYRIIPFDPAFFET